MDKFWEWMEENLYCRDGHSYSEVMNDKDFFNTYKNMLIGYMIEYLMENKVKISESIPFHLESMLDIDGIYNWLKLSIEKLDKI